MKVTKNKNGTFDLTEVSAGKLIAIVNAINDLQKTNFSITPVQKDVRDILHNTIYFWQLKE